MPDKRPIPQPTMTARELRLWEQGKLQPVLAPYQTTEARRAEKRRQADRYLEASHENKAARRAAFRG